MNFNLKRYFLFLAIITGLSTAPVFADRIILDDGTEQGIELAELPVEVIAASTVLANAYQRTVYDGFLGLFSHQERIIPFNVVRDTMYRSHDSAENILKNFFQIFQNAKNLSGTAQEREDNIIASYFSIPVKKANDNKFIKTQISDHRIQLNIEEAENLLAVSDMLKFNDVVKRAFAKIFAITLFSFIDETQTTSKNYLECIPPQIQQTFYAFPKNIQLLIKREFALTFETLLDGKSLECTDFAQTRELVKEMINKKMFPGKTSDLDLINTNDELVEYIVKTIKKYSGFLRRKVLPTFLGGTSKELLLKNWYKILPASIKNQIKIYVWIANGKTPDTTIDSITGEEWQLLANNGRIPSLGGFDFNNKSLRTIAKKYFDKYNVRFINIPLMWKLVENNTLAEWIKPFPEKFKTALKLYHHCYMLKLGHDEWLDDQKIDVPVSYLVEMGIVPTPINASIGTLANLEEQGKIDVEAELFAKHLIRLENIKGLSRIEQLTIYIKRLVNKKIDLDMLGVEQEIESILKNLPAEFKTLIGQKYAQITELTGALLENENAWGSATVRISLKTLLDNEMSKLKLENTIIRTNTLDLSDKIIFDLAASDFYALNYCNLVKTLILTGNRFETLPANIFYAFPALEKIVISDNVNLKTLPAILFANNPHLRQIIICNNPNLKTNKNLLGAGLSKQLDLLDLSGNNLENNDLPLFLNHSIKILNLANNRITALPQDSYQDGLFVSEYAWQTIESLYLANNKNLNLENVANKFMPALKALNLADCGITEIKPETFSQLKGLQKLYLNNNNISSITVQTFAELTNLEDLWLQANNIAAIPAYAFKNNAKLRTLVIFANKQDLIVQDSAFEGLSNLVNLNLHSNGIKCLTSSTFAGLSSLQNLGLANNTIKNVPSNAFAGLKNLRTLDLENNGISSLETQALPKCRLIKYCGNNSSGLGRLPSTLRSTSSFHSRVEKEWYNRLHTIWAADTVRAAKFVAHTAKFLCDAAAKQMRSKLAAAK